MMKCIRILKLLSAVMIFILFSVIIPVAPVRAATGNITIFPNSGAAGSTVTVQGSGFPVVANQTYYVWFDTTTITATSSSTGSFSASFIVPQRPRISFGYPVKVTTTALDDSNIIYFQIIPDITLSATSGYVGDSILISGRGFTESSTVTFYYDNVATGASVTVGTNGTFSSTGFSIPASPRGSRIIKARDGTSTVYSQDVTFSVNNRMTVTPTSGAVGDKLTITGTGFAANKTISFYWDDNAMTGESAATDGNGGFATSLFTVPMTPRGSHTIKAQDGNSNESTATFAVAQRMTMSPASGVAGTIVAVSGNGYIANTVISVKYNAAPVVTNPATINTNNNGSFSGTFTVPAGIPGTFTVEVSDGTYSATASYTATFNATISTVTSSSAPGLVGMQLTISGVGFKPNAQVTTTYLPEGKELEKTNTDTIGTFSVRVTIPPMVGGDHTIRVSDGTINKDFPFFMEKMAPAVPELLAPITTAKVKVPKAKNITTFDWKDVTDPSGVSYTMQIALDKDFNKMGIEKKGLTKSEYALAPTEKLPSNKASIPYYWRVKATDGALNESAWSTAQAFNVGFSLELTGWVLYVILGVGGLLIFLLGFLLGSRRSLSY